MVNGVYHILMKCLFTNIDEKGKIGNITNRKFNYILDDNGEF